MYYLKLKQNFKKYKNINKMNSNNLYLLIKAVDEIEYNKFPGWEKIVFSIFYSVNNKPMCMNDIMIQLDKLYPMWSKKGPNGGNTIRNTISAICCNYFNTKKMKVNFKCKKKGRFYSFSENIII